MQNEMSSNKTQQDTKKVQEKTEKFDKYLTDIKELPPTPKDDAGIGKPVEKTELKKAKEEKGTTRAVSPTKVKRVDSDPVKKVKDVGDTRETSSEEPENAKASTSIFTFKDIILGIINIISIVLIVFLLFKLPQKAIEYQAEKVTHIKNQVSPQSEFGNIGEDSEKATKLDSLFLDESGVVRFVSDVEKLKVNYPAISKVTFASPKAVKDEMGLFGIPVTIELKGGWDTFGPALEKIQGLPYLFRPISINVGPLKEDPSVLVLDYGVFLYIDENTEAN
jgi:hypothetical protein